MKALHYENVAPSVPRVPVAKLAGHDGPVQTIVFTKDGKYCLTGGHDRSVKLWNPARVDPAYTSEDIHSNSNSNSTILPPVLNIQTYAQGYTHAISALATAESSSSSQQQLLLAASDKTLVVSDMVTNQVLRRLQGHHTGRINAIAAPSHGGGQAYLSASYDGTVAIWDGRSRAFKPIQVLKEAKDSVTDVYIAGNDNDNEVILRTASVDGIVRSYDLRKGMCQCDNMGSPITSMAPTHDGQCLAVNCLDGTIRLIETSQQGDGDGGQLLNTYSKSHYNAGQYGLGICILANDATIATGSEDGSCVLYDLVRAECIQSLQASSSSRRPTCAIAAHPKDSAMVVTASYDSNTTVWSHDASRWRMQLLPPPSM